MTRIEPGVVCDDSGLGSISGACTRLSIRGVVEFPGRPGQDYVTAGGEANHCGATYRRTASAFAWGLRRLGVAMNCTFPGPRMVCSSAARLGEGLTFTFAPGDNR